MLLRWHARDLQALAARLRGLGFSVDADLRVRFEDGAIDLVGISESAAGQLELVESTNATPDHDAASHANGLRRVVAVGWATVDLDRAAADSGLGADERTELASDRVLGARAVLLGAGPVVLLEPDTEGRLAASLARYGEGPAAIYLASGDRATLQRARLTASGPFGPSAALDAADSRGPHLIACDGRPIRSTTIAP